jgi:hypothetical protein
MPTLLSPEVAGCFARACHVIAENNPFVNKNDLFKTILADRDINGQAVADEVVHHFVQEKFPICEQNHVLMENRPKKGRNVGECMDNCIAEFKETGNQIRMGLVSSAQSPLAAMAVIHFFNVDKHGRFYDTEDRGMDRKPTPATLLKFNHNEVAHILAGRQQAFLKEANDWLSIWDEMNKKTYILSRTFGERGAFKFVKTLGTTIQGTKCIISGV